jgi:hypothetical protein
MLSAPLRTLPISRRRIAGTRSSVRWCRHVSAEVLALNVAFIVGI